MKLEDRRWDVSTHVIRFDAGGLEDFGFVAANKKLCSLDYKLLLNHPVRSFFLFTVNICCFSVLQPCYVKLKALSYLLSNEKGNVLKKKRERNEKCVFEL